MDMIKSSSITLEFLNTGQQGIPLIICTDSERVYKRLESANYKVFQLNEPISKALLDYSPDERPTRVEAVFKKTLNTDSPILIKNFEMLFDPNYHLDVLKVFCELARQFRIAIIWCGTFHDNVLEFAEPDYSDYHSYHVDQYTVYCIN